MKYFSCYVLERFHLVFDVTSNIKRLVMCCESSGKSPGITFCETAEETVKSFVKEHTNIIQESINLASQGKLAADENRLFSSRCAKCPNFRLDNWMGGGGQIRHIVMSVYPSPCQCKCIYCYCAALLKVVPDKLYMENFEKILDIMEYAQKNDFIAKDAKWEISSGEISIHPCKDRILNLVKNEAALFFTNCFIYDEKIAAILGTNPQSAIKLSIDAGTPETWRKIKGVDNLKTVIDNLAKYSASCVNPEQITLKYIVLPGINDNLEEYGSLIEIMKSLKIKHLDISCDLRTKKSNDKKQREPLIQATENLAAMLCRNGMAMKMNWDYYFPNEIQRIENFIYLVKK